jgi:HJR/Mrr/RecB family endonuclease
MAILTSLPSARYAAENPYHDRIEGNVLVYTGAGREGDQSLAGVNRRIPQQISENFPIYGFQLIGSRRDRTIGQKRWRFLGLLEYVRHYPEHQLDTRGEMRQVWVFELALHIEPQVVPVDVDRPLSEELLRASNLRRGITEADRDVVGPIALSDRDDGRDRAIEVESERMRLLGLSPQEFEHWIKTMLIATGFEKVVVTKYSQDGGIDVNAFAGRSMWPIRELLIQVQAKRWLHTVGRKEVAELRGSLQPFARGSVVTTSHFSKAAINEAEEAGKNPIVLIDGYALAKIALTQKAREM